MSKKHLKNANLVSSDDEKAAKNPAWNGSFEQVLRTRFQELPFRYQ